MTSKRDSKRKPRSDKDPKLVLPKETVKDLEPVESENVKGGHNVNTKH